MTTQSEQGMHARSESNDRHIDSALPHGFEDQLDLAELFRVLWNRKWQIIAIELFFVALGTAYALLATEIFRAEVVLAPTRSEQQLSLPGGLGGLASLAGLNLNESGDVTEAVATLRSNALVEEFISENDLLPVLFSDDWDSENSQWRIRDVEDWPDLRDGVKYFVEDVRSVNEDSSTGLVTLTIDWRDPEAASEWANELVYRVNERIRARDLAESQQRLEYLNEQLEGASLVELRQAISRLIENQIQNIMLAQADAEYAFQVIDPPRVPKERLWPVRSLVVALSAFAGIIVAILGALFLDGRARRSNALQSPTGSK